MEALRDLLDVLVPLMHVEPVTVDDHEAGVAALMAAGRRQLSLVDCVSFAIMRRRGIRRFLAVDRHFAERGLEPYTPATPVD